MMPSAYAHTTTDAPDDRESVTYECTMCEYRDDLQADYGTVWHDCENCEASRFFDPVEEQPVVDKV